MLKVLERKAFEYKKVQRLKTEDLISLNFFQD